VNIIIYETDSGKIIKSMTCPEEMISIQYDHETQNFLEHDRVDDTLYKVDLNTLEIIPVE
jgi:hypothetical protein